MIRSYQEVRQVIRWVEGELQAYLPDYSVALIGERSDNWARISVSGIDAGKKMLYLNRALVEQGSMKSIADTVYHEIAHVYDSKRFKSEHSQDWRNIARALGASGKTTTKYPEVVLPLMRFRFRCSKCGYEFDSTDGTVAPHYLEGHEDHPGQKFYVLDTITGKRWSIVGHGD